MRIVSILCRTGRLRADKNAMSRQEKDFLFYIYMRTSYLSYKCCLRSLSVSARRTLGTPRTPRLGVHRLSKSVFQTEFEKSENALITIIVVIKLL